MATIPRDAYPLLINKATELRTWLDLLPQSPTIPTTPAPESPQEQLVELPCGCRPARALLEAHLRSAESCPVCAFELFDEFCYEDFRARIDGRQRRIEASGDSCCLCRSAYIDKEEGEGEEPVRLSCGHVFGYRCIRKWTDPEPDGSEKNTCPLCREQLFGPLEVEDDSQNDEDQQQEEEVDDAEDEAETTQARIESAENEAAAQRLRENPDDAASEGSAGSAQTDNFDRLVEQDYEEWERVGRVNGWLLHEENLRDNPMPLLGHVDEVEEEIQAVEATEPSNQEARSDEPVTIHTTKKGTEAPAHSEADIEPEPITAPGSGQEVVDSERFRADVTIGEEPEVAREQEITQRSPPTEPNSIAGRLRRRRQEERANAAFEEEQSRFDNLSDRRKRRHDEGGDGGLDEAPQRRTRRQPS